MFQHISVRIAAAEIHQELFTPVENVVSVDDVQHFVFSLHVAPSDRFAQTLPVLALALGRDFFGRKTVAPVQIVAHTAGTLLGEHHVMLVGILRRSITRNRGGKDAVGRRIGGHGRQDFVDTRQLLPVVLEVGIDPPIVHRVGNTDGGRGRALLDRLRLGPDEGHVRLEQRHAHGGYRKWQHARNGRIDRIGHRDGTLRNGDCFRSQQVLFAAGMQELLQLYAPRKSLRDEHTLPVVDFAMPLAVENANSPVRFRIRQGLPSFVVFRFRRGKISDFRIADGIAARNIYGNEMQRFRTFEPPGHLARKTHFEAVAPPPGAGLSQIVHRRIRAVFLFGCCGVLSLRSGTLHRSEQAEKQQPDYDRQMFHGYRM